MQKLKGFKIGIILSTIIVLALVLISFRTNYREPVNFKKFAFKSIEYDIFEKMKKSKPGVNLNKLDPDMQQKSFELLSRNARNPLFIPTYEGSNQPVHPKVVAFSEPWNGYKYWMAFTPYPKSYDVYENPSIVVSNNLINWDKPKGLENPLQKPEKKQIAPRYHYSDPHLLFNNVNKKMEIWYRYTRGDIVEQIYRQTSSDGINWSNKELMLDVSNKAVKGCMSPAIIFENNKYRMWYVDYNSKLNYIESSDGLNWSNSVVQDLKFDASGKYYLWHLDIEKTDIGYEMLACAFKEGMIDRRILFYTKSSDGSVWNKAEPLILPSPNSESWDSKQIYRSSLLKIDSMYYIFYSAQGQNNRWGIGLTSGTDIENLKGYNDLIVERLPNFENHQKIFMYDNKGLLAMKR